MLVVALARRTVQSNVVVNRIAPVVARKEIILLASMLKVDVFPLPSTLSDQSDHCGMTFGREKKRKNPRIFRLQYIYLARVV